MSAVDPGPRRSAAAGVRGPVPGAWAVARIAGRCLRSDCRRPEVWLVCATAAGAACHAAGVAGPAGLATAICVGGLLGVAAVGDAPTGRCDPGGRVAWGWLGARLAWPAAGLLGGLTAGGFGPAWFGTAAGLALMTGGGLADRLTRRGTPAAEAAALALLGVFAAAGAALALPEAGPAGLTLVVGVALAVSWLTTSGGLSAAPPTGPGGDLRGLTEAGPVSLMAVAMAASLIGMAGWLFLGRDQEWCAGLHALAWFVVLAVPRLTLGVGAGDAPARQRLCRTAPGRVRLADPAWRGAAALEFEAAAILGWPLVVALVLRGPGDRAGLLRVGALVLGAAGTAALGARAARAGGLAAGTVHAALLCVVVWSAVLAGPMVTTAAGRPGGP